VQFLQEVEPIHFSHLDVEQNGRIVLLEGHFQTFSRIHARFDSQAGIRQNTVTAGTHNLFIVDYKDSIFKTHGFALSVVWFRTSFFSNQRTSGAYP